MPPAAKGRFDLVTDFAFHVPIIVASEIIGIPATIAMRSGKRLRAHAVADGAEAFRRLLDEGARGRQMDRPLFARTDRRSAARVPESDLISALIAEEQERTSA
jgi:cytochrome P450